MKPRKYQSDFIDAIYAKMEEHNAVMAVSPTGAGKTVVANELMRNEVMDRAGRCLFLAHRKELLTQTQEKLWRAHRIPGAIIQGSRMTDYQMPVQIASVQTLKNRNMPKNISLVITDEAHHATASTYQHIYKQYPDAKFIGFTATPWRLSGKGFDDTFTGMVQSVTIRELEKMGFLCRAKQAIVPMNRRAFSEAVHISSTGDYNQDELGRFMSSDPMVQVAVSSWFNYAEGKQTIIFASSIEQSKAIIDELRRKGVTCVHVDGTTPDDIRAAHIKGFEQKRYRVLCNVGIATEGTDIPSIECVLLARPTKSLSLYLQMCGRGSRTLPNKDHYNLIDISDNILEHGHPNKDQRWTLEARDVKSERLYTRWFRVMLPDGTLLEISRDNVPNVPGIKALEIQPPARINEYDRLLIEAQRKGYKQSAAYYQFIKTHGTPTVRELQHIQQRTGLPSSWVRYRCQEFGLTAT